MANVRLNQISKHFGPHAAVQDASFQAGAGQLLVIVGPSGCGKTTTLRMIAGLEEPSVGNIYFDDRDMTRVPPRQRNVAMVFQHGALYPHMTVRNNMAFGLKMRRTPPDVQNHRIQQTSTLLGIEELLDRKPGQLSGGESQRVALGKAIVQEPDVFLLDEPLSHLDALLRARMRRELVKLQQRLNATMLYVTHDQSEAMMMGDRIAVMNEGRILQIGSPVDIYNHPANRFVAGFFGDPAMSFLDGVVTKKSDSLYIDFQAFELPLPCPRFGVCQSHEGQPVTLGIRPEHVFVLQRVDDLDGLPAVNVKATWVKPMGRGTLINLQIGGHEFTSDVKSSVNYRTGDALTICIDMSRCHLFDPETNRNLLSTGGMQ